MVALLNLYVYNRQGACVFYTDWYRPQTVQQGVGTPAADQKQMFGFIWTMSNLCVALDPKDPNKQPLGTPRRTAQGCQFHSCTTTNYKLHFLETATGYKLVLNTGREAGDLRELLMALYDELLVERLGKNPAFEPGTVPSGQEDIAHAVTAWFRQRGIS